MLDDYEENEDTSRYDELSWLYEHTLEGSGLEDEDGREKAHILLVTPDSDPSPVYRQMLWEYLKTFAPQSFYRDILYGLVVDEETFAFIPCPDPYKALFHDHGLVMTCLRQDLGRRYMESAFPAARIIEMAKRVASMPDFARLSQEDRFKELQLRMRSGSISASVDQTPWILEERKIIQRYAPEIQRRLSLLKNHDEHLLWKEIPAAGIHLFGTDSFQGYAKLGESDSPVRFGIPYFLWGESLLDMWHHQYAARLAGIQEWQSEENYLYFQSLHAIEGTRTIPAIKAMEKEQLSDMPTFLRSKGLDPDTLFENAAG